MQRTFRAAAAVLAVASMAVGCGGNDDADDAGTETEATLSDVAAATEETATTTTDAPADASSRTLPPPSGPGDLEAWCSGWINGGSVDLPTPEEEDAALVANAVEMQRVVPEEVREAWIAFTGGPSVPEDDFRQAYRVIDKFFLDNCDMISVGTPITAAP